jgi:hypothetical protein
MIHSKFNKKSIWIIILQLYCLNNGMGQPLLSRPHTSSIGDRQSSVNLGVDVSMTSKYNGASAYISTRQSVLPKYALHSSFSFFCSKDTLTEKTDKWYTRNYEIGIGKSRSMNHFFTQTNFNIGHDYFRYLYYDTFKIRRDCEYYKFTPSLQYIAGYNYKSFEIGISIKAMGYFNWYSKGPQASMRSDSKTNYNSLRTAQSNIIIEPMLFASVKIQEIYYLRITARNQMIRNIQNQFPFENKFYYSAGLFVSLTQ